MVNQLVNDQEYQRKLALQDLLESAGMKYLREEIENHMLEVGAKIDSQMKSGFISESGLNLFNYNLGRKAGLTNVLNVLKNFEDDLIGDDVKPPKK